MTSAPPGSRAPAAAGRRRLTVAGTVQGVGFRPFLYRRARARGLAGFAVNGPEGVTVEVEGPAPALAAFIRDIRERPPANAVIQGIHEEERPLQGGTGFRIEASAAGAGTGTAVLPDLATCDQCLAEVFDPANRRYRYPFTNCTACGPRYSILRDLPYDRERTSMDRFPMCPACAAEYADPGDRRFHAEPNACPECGPQLVFREPGSLQGTDGHEAIEAAAASLRQGRILALKGLGGFQLMADARDPGAVARLRARKGRPEKPLAVMAPGLAAVRAACRVSDPEERLLAGRERPIVLLRRRGDAGVAAEVAPGNPYLGVMLPYTPLHHLLLAELGFPVVATSGNRSGEPMATDGAEAERRLGDIADAFLDHDRPIVRPVDDSVARVFRGEPQVLRRARGYAPAPIPAGETSPGVLALGGHLKSAVALTQDDGIVLSQHIGDLDHPLSRDAHGAVTDGLLRLYQGRPRVLACDAHPDYATTVRAEEWSERKGLPLVRVPHHLAHVAAGMAEHGLAPPVLGVAWDGTGYGPDGTIWGGELIRVTGDGWQRAGHLRSFRLPGGAAAIREPWRAALGLLYELFGPEALAMDHLAPVAGRSAAERRTLGRLLEQGTNAPVTTSAGRLFDGVAALLGLRQVADHEGQAACTVEWAADAGGEAPPYALIVGEPDPDTGARVLDWGPALRDLLADGAAGVPIPVRAARFHHGLAAAVAEAVRALGDDTVLLTGGCFQNALLADRTVDRLEADGRRVLWPRAVPPGDGGLALGQAFWAARMKEKGAPSCA